MSYLEQKLRLFCSDALDFISPIIFLHPSFRHPVLHVCYCDHTLTNISGKNNISPFNAATRPPATISPPLLTPSSTHLGQSILHAITRWHGWRCPGNCCNTSVAWSLRTNKRRGPARLLRHREPGGMKGLRECRGVEGHTPAAAALPRFHLMISSWLHSARSAATEMSG